MKGISLIFLKVGVEHKYSAERFCGFCCESNFTSRVVLCNDLLNILK